MAANVFGLGRLLCALTLLAWGHFVFADACDDKPPVTFSYQCSMTNAGYWACPTALSYQGCNYSSGGGGSCTSQGICSTKWFPSGPAGSGSTPCGTGSCAVVGGGGSSGGGSTDPDPDEGSGIPVDTFYLYTVRDTAELKAKDAAFSAFDACHIRSLKLRDDNAAALSQKSNLNISRSAYSSNHGKYGTCATTLYLDGRYEQFLDQEITPTFYFKCPDYDPKLCAQVYDQVSSRDPQDGNDESVYNDVLEPSSSIDGGVQVEDLNASTDRVVDAINAVTGSVDKVAESVDKVTDAVKGTTSSVDRVGDAIGVSLSGLGTTLSTIASTLGRIEGLVGQGGNGGGNNGGGNNGGGDDGSEGGGPDKPETPYDPSAEWTDIEAHMVGRSTGQGIASSIDAAVDSAQESQESELQAKFDALPDTVSGMLTPARGALESVKHFLPTAEGCRDYVIPLDLMQYKADLTLPVCELSRVKPLLEWVLYVITVIAIWNVFYAGLRQQDAKATKGGF